ncbi:hypothetical protein EK904_002093, partial [Melospiza melodia maxima]
FLKEQRVHLENVGSHDIVDGNHRLTLGLIWTIILRFQVPPGSSPCPPLVLLQLLQLQVSPDRSSPRSRRRGEELGRWRGPPREEVWWPAVTSGVLRSYPEVNIQNFTTSWRDGLAFNALIHRHRSAAAGRAREGPPGRRGHLRGFLGGRGGPEVTVSTPPHRRPDLIDFHKLTKSNATYNLQQAFNTAEQHLGLSKLLDPEGTDGVRPSVHPSVHPST